MRKHFRGQYFVQKCLPLNEEKFSASSFLFRFMFGETRKPFLAEVSYLGFYKVDNLQIQNIWLLFAVC